MRITAKVDYAVRAAAELAAHAADHGASAPMKGDAVATAQGIPVRFLESILAELRRSGIVGSQRGSEGGYWLARPAERGVGGRHHPGRRGAAGRRPRHPAGGGGVRRGRRRAPTGVDRHPGRAAGGARETTTLADIASGALPERVVDLAARPDGWARR